MKKYFPIIIATSFLCFFLSIISTIYSLKYTNIFMIFGCFLFMLGLAFFLFGKNDVLINTADVKENSKNISVGWFVVIILGILEIFLAVGAQNDDNHILGWLFFFSVPLFGLIFIVNLIIQSSSKN